VTDSEISEFFAKYAQAVGSNDLPAIAACYATPSLVVSDSVTVSVPDRKAVQSAFTGAFETYEARGLVGARALVDQVDRLTERLALVAITWEYQDVQGGTQPGESYRYLVRLGDQPGICVVIPLV
jgi:Domain of unknown function (DUF4440)